MGKKPWAIGGGNESKLGCFKIVELNMPSCRVFSVLSENLNTIVIEQTEPKLWPPKR